MSIDVNVQNDLVIVTESSEDIVVNVSNAAGPAGVGVPTGGSTGQVLKKLTNTDYDTYWALDGGGVPYSGATGDVNLGEFQLRAGQVTLDTTPTGTASVATTRWNDSLGIAETTLKGGNVVLKNGIDLVARVVNKVTPNTTLTKAAYQAVRVSGAQGQRLAVAYAQANNDANSADTIGLVCETIATNQEGFIMAMGQLENINTTGGLQGETWVDGDVLYLSPFTPGAITKVKPTGAGHIVVIGYVEYAHVNNGKIYVKVMNGWELDELHDVDIVTPANNEALIYESSTALWKNKTIATALGYTPLSGSGVAGQVAYWNGTNSQTGSNNLFWDAANARLGIGTNAPGFDLSIVKSTSATISLQSTSSTGFCAINIYDSSATQIGGLGYGNTGTFSTFANKIYLASISTPISIILNSIEKVRFFNNGNVLIQNGGTYTDNGFLLDVAGTARIQGNTSLVSSGTTELSIRSTITTGFSSMNFYNSSGTIVGGLGYGNSGVVASYANKFYFAGANSVPFSFLMGGTEYVRLFYSGNLLLQNGGTFTDGGQRLQVYGDAFVRGSGATSATSALLVQNSASTEIFRIYNEGTSQTRTAFFIGTDTNYLSLKNNGGGTNPKQIEAYWGGAIPYGIQINTNISTDTSVGNGYGLQVRNAFSQTFTTGNYTNILVNTTFSPTSGTGTQTQITISPTISQSGGANGITRGLYVNPTLSAAADWRSIEWSNNTGWGLYGAGTANNYLGGRLGIGNTNPTNILDILVNANSIQYVSFKNNSSGVDASGGYIATNNNNQNGGFVVYSSTFANSIYANNLGIGHNKSIVISTDTNVASGGTSKISFVNGGYSVTPQMTLTTAGRLLLGTTTEGTFLLDVNGTARVSGNVTISTGTTSQGTLISGGSATRYTSNTGINTSGIYTNSTATDQDVLAAYVSGGATSNLYLYVQSNGYIGTRGGMRLGAASGTDVVTQITNTWLNVAAGTTARSQINLASSTAPTSPNNGDIWFDGTDLKMRIGGVTKTFTLV